MEILQQFTIPYEPPRATHQGSLKVLKTADGRLFVGKPKSRYKKKILPGQKTVEFYSHLLARHRPAHPWPLPLGLSIKWVFKFPSDVSAKFKKEFDEWFCTTRPDNGNNLKIIEDCMQAARFFTDDAQLSDHILMKRVGVNPRIEVALFKPEL